MDDPTPTPDAPGVLRRLYDELIALDPAARQERLARIAPAAPLRRRLESLLAAASERDALVDSPVVDLIQSLRDDERFVRGLIGTDIGPFRVVAPVGEGGSSTVFRAERAAGDATQTVALKLLRHGLYSADARWRFQREQSILAQLTHPSIARLVEAGVSDGGVPYIAMEYVDGLPITHAAERHGFDLRARLACFLALCRAVEAAHGALVVHRDLKPSNVLVTADGTVKVLDFGIAKLIDESADAGDAVTRTRLTALTPEYAAPEQFSSGPVRTSTDVYALGVLLGELLLGRRLRDLGAMRLSDAPAAPGFRVPNGLPAAPLLARQLRGDLDAIVATATEEDATRRYRSAGALADDIERHLAGKPVQAHPPTRWYRVRKFIRRHRGGVALTVLFCLGILVSLAFALLQAHRASREAERAQATRDFLVDVFTEVEPAGPRAPPPTVVEVVEAALARLEREHRSARVRLDLGIQLGRILRNQSRVERATQVLRRAVEDGSAAFDRADPMLFDARCLLGETLIVAGDYAAVDALIDALAADVARQDLRRRVDFALLALNLANKRGRVDDAMTHLQRAERECGDACEDGVQLALSTARAVTLTDLGRHEEAAASFERSVDLARRLHGAQHVEVATALNGLAGAYRRLGRFAQAQRIGLEVLAIDDAVLPDPHWRRSIHWNYLGSAYVGLHDDAAAANAFEQAAAQARAVAGEDPSIAGDLTALGAAQTRLGAFAAARATQSEALERAERGYGAGNVVTARIRGNFGFNLALQGAFDEGAAALDRAIRDLQAAGAPAQGALYDALRQRAHLHLLRGAPAQSLATIAEADALAAAMATPPAAPRRALLDFVRALAAARAQPPQVARPVLDDVLRRLELQGTDRASLAAIRLALAALADTSCTAAQPLHEAARADLAALPFVLPPLRASEEDATRVLRARGCVLD
jgi:hypothetical protein